MCQLEPPYSRQTDTFSPGIVWSDPSRVHGHVVQGHKRPLHEEFPLRLRKLRKRAGLTRGGLGRMLHWSASDLAELEDGGRQAAIDTVERLAAALGVPASWLAYGEEAHLPFRQRQPRVILPPDPPEPSPAPREASGSWTGVHERLRSARAATGLSLRAVAAAAGISPQALSVAEAGRMSPKVRTCESLAAALDVAPGWLAYGEDVSD